MAHGAPFGREPERRLVTQQEAAEMIDLWTPNAEGPGAGLIDLRDVAESLHISEYEASHLLAQVRREPVRRKRPLPVVLSVFLKFLLFLTLVWSTGAVWILITDVLRFHRFEPLDMGALMLSLAWTLGWITYYRRPLGRFFGGIVRGLETGKP